MKIEELSKRLTDRENPVHVHLIGVAGSGMSGLSLLLLGMGHKVSGSDRVTSGETERMQGVGLIFSCPHRADEVHGCDVVVYSSAIGEENVARAEAREHGDLKENAEYHAAREQQSFTEGRIQSLESALSSGQIIDVAALNVEDRVVFGAKVELEDLETEEMVNYQIVGDIEADIKLNKIAVSSPIARALVGKEVGDVAVVKAPNGLREYEIISATYSS